MTIISYAWTFLPLAKQLARGDQLSASSFYPIESDTSQSVSEKTVCRPDVELKTGAKKRGGRQRGCLYVSAWHRRLCLRTSLNKDANTSVDMFLWEWCATQILDTRASLLAQQTLDADGNKHRQRNLDRPTTWPAAYRSFWGQRRRGRKGSSTERTSISSRLCVTIRLAIIVLLTTRQLVVLLTMLHFRE